MPMPREIAALCEPIVADNGVYVTHMRGYGPQAPVGMREVYDIAKQTGVPAHISHYNGPRRALAAARSTKVVPSAST